MGQPRAVLQVPVSMEYAPANRLEHPRNVTLREDVLLRPFDEWLAGKFEPRSLPPPSTS
jgi:hypothetical protein